MARRPHPPLASLACATTGLVAVTLCALVGACSNGPAGAPDAGDTSQDTGDTAQDAGVDTSEPGGCALPLDGTITTDHTLRFGNADGSTVVAIRRTYEGPGVGESFLFGLATMTVEHTGACTRIEDSARLTYENSHHNWLDKAVARDANVRYELVIAFDIETGFGWIVTLSAFDEASDQLLWDDATLVTTAAPLFCYACPGSLPVGLYEVQLDNVSTLADEAGDYDPWLELFNTRAEDADLSGYGLSNDPANPFAWTFPQGRVIPGHGFAIVWLDGEPAEGPLHTSFALGAGETRLILSAPDLTSVGERAFPPTAPDASWAYSWDSSGFEESASPTPNADNGL